VQLENTYQLNFGGNTDFLNMLERERLESKKISKTNAVTSQLDVPLEAKHVHVGPSDYVPWLSDRKWAFIRLEGTTFGDVPLNVELKLEVHDSPNSAGIVIDAVRLCKIALDKGVKGALYGPSSWLMKSPPQQYHDDEAHRLAEEFITHPVSRPGVPARRKAAAAPARARARKPVAAKKATSTRRAPAAKRRASARPVAAETVPAEPSVPATNGSAKRPRKTTARAARTSSAPAAPSRRGRVVARSAARGRG